MRVRLCQKPTVPPKYSNRSAIMKVIDFHLLRLVGAATSVHRARLSARTLFANDRGLFANGGDFVMMEGRCFLCQLHRNAHGSHAEVRTGKYDSLGRQAVRGY